MSLERRVQEQEVVRIDDGILLSHAKERDVAIGGNAMDPGGIAPSETSQRETNAIRCHLCVEPEGRNKRTSKTETDS